MSENQNCGIGDMSKYDAMTTEELEEILRLNAQTLEEQESDTEMILYIMEVLAERERNNGHIGKTAHEAYESFKQNYMPEKDNDILPCEISSKPPKRFPRWARGLVATAAVLAILLIGSATAKAFGLDVWKVVIQWSQETFHFGDEGHADTDNDLPYASLQEALKKSNTPVWLVPTYIPEGFSLLEVNVEQTPLKKMYRAQYTYGEKDLAIVVWEYLSGDPVYVEQSDGLVEEYKVADITYYLFENNKQVQAVWIVDSYECYISGDVTIDELRIMVSSIKKG